MDKNNNSLSNQNYKNNYEHLLMGANIRNNYILSNIMLP